MNYNKFIKLVSFFFIVTIITSYICSASAATIVLNRNSSYDETTVETNINKCYVYKIFDATKEGTEIGNTTDSNIGSDTTGVTGVSYFMKNNNPWKQTLDNIALFTLYQAADGSGWQLELQSYIESNETTAKRLAKALKEDLPYVALTGEYAAQELTPGVPLTVDDGYYLIVSDIGENLVLATSNINITEKNGYPKVHKTIADEDLSAQIGESIHYTLTIEVPTGANQRIVLTDTMSEGLTFEQIVDSTVDYQLSSVDPDTNSFTITFADNIVKEHQGETIIVEYTAFLNENAFYLNPETNEVYLEYGNNYRTTPEEVETDTYMFQVLKYDGNDATKHPLAGASFQITNDDGIVHIVKVTNDTYRVATHEEESVETFQTVNTNKTSIYGLDKDITYYLNEVEPPAGYNKISGTFTINIPTDRELVVDVPNNKGVVLPSTGGIGTAPYLIGGGALASISAIILVVKRKAESDD